MKLTAIAIDDEPKALDVVRLHAEKVPFLELNACFTDAFEAIPYLQKHPVDLLFIDIKMPDISGIDFVKCLQKVPMVVFTTAYSEYAVQGFELDALDYLLKPFSLARFTKTCNKALAIKQMQGNQVQDFIFVKTGYEEEKIQLAEILYIEAEGNYLSIVTPLRKLMCRLTMTEMLQLLPPAQFVRLHRSYIIAIAKIEKMTRQGVWIAGKEIPLGASFEDQMEVIREKLKGAY
jgi:DNA-binding LytR/AlgR family response regulator